MPFLLAIDTMNLYIERHPYSALSARLVNSLDNVNKQQEHIHNVIDKVAYSDWWETYFDFMTQNNKAAITTEIIFMALRAVGLDPQSTHLWITAANLCKSQDEARQIFLLGLAVPLFHVDKLYDAYIMFEKNQNSTAAVSREECLLVSSIVKKEHWPLRYADMDCETEQVDIKQQWSAHIEFMNSCIHKAYVAEDLQIQRMDLAYKQMCSQLHDDDSSWYAYALFQITFLNDIKAAMHTVQCGLKECDNSSLALINLLASIQAPRSFDVSACNLSEGSRALVRQRIALGKLVSAKSNENVRELRAIGKESATKGLCEWKLYSQWCALENAVLRNDKMAAKVLENGMVCCASVANDTILLEQEAILYHLNHGRDRESIGCTEQQIELLSESSFAAHKRSAWNMLVRTEQAIGLPALDAEARRDVFFPQSRLYSFFERCTVSNYLPCDPETWFWLQLTEDIASEMHQQKEATNTTTQPARYRAIGAPLVLTDQCSTPDTQYWSELPLLNDSHNAGNFDDNASSSSPDDVVGPRELRGRWVYRIKNTYATVARLKREERQHGLKRGTTLAVGITEGPIGGLLKRLKLLTLKEAQKENIQHLASSTLVQWLATTNLQMKHTQRHKLVHKSHF